MKILPALVLALSVTAPALAGDGGCADGLQGFDCDNMCPLARTANTHRALGTEAPRISAVLREDLARKVEANLARI